MERLHRTVLGTEFLHDPRTGVAFSAWLFGFALTVSCRPIDALGSALSRCGYAWAHACNAWPRWRQWCPVRAWRVTGGLTFAEDTDRAWFGTVSSWRRVLA